MKKYVLYQIFNKNRKNYLCYRYKYNLFII